MIEVKNLTKEFHDRKRGTVRAVDAVSFQCQPGKIFGLLGANGAGKTTTLRMLATLLAPSGGRALVVGHDVALAPNQVRRNIGYISNSMALYGRLTAREMIEYFGRLHGLSGAKLHARVGGVIEELAIGPFAEGRCDRLSTGQKQRVSIGRAIVHQPQVLIFDEPTNGLDVMTSRTITGFIHRCRQEGRTVIFSSHIMSEVERLCDEIAVMHGGRIRGCGTIAELRARTGQERLESVFLALAGEPEDATL